MTKLWDEGSRSEAHDLTVVEPREASAPFRHRHDGWTPERQERFLERLAETGCVREACRTVGLSSTSGYRAYARMPDFAQAWNRALAARRPMLEDAAFERAVRGAVVPIVRGGKVVAQRLQFSDALLRFLIARADRREEADAKAAAEAEAETRQKADAEEDLDTALAKALAELHAGRRKEAERVAAAAVTADAGED